MILGGTTIKSEYHCDTSQKKKKKVNIPGTNTSELQKLLQGILSQRFLTSWKLQWNYHICEVYLWSFAHSLMHLPMLALTWYGIHDSKSQNPLQVYYQDEYTEEKKYKSNRMERTSTSFLHNFINAIFFTIVYSVNQTKNLLPWLY